MRLGELDFTFEGDSELTTNYNVDQIEINTGIMQYPTIHLHGTYPEDRSVRFNNTYSWSLVFKDIFWTGYLTPIQDSNPTKTGEITVDAILAPYELALGKSSRYYQSIDDAVNVLCAGFLDLGDLHYSCKEGFYNQLGENNIDFALQMAIKSYSGMIPGFTHRGLRFVDMYSDEEGVDLSNMGGAMDNSGSLSTKSPKDYELQVDLFEVKSTSSHHYGTMREKMNIEIVGSEYFDAFIAESTNKQILEDSKKAISITLSEFVPYCIGDVVKFVVDGDLTRFIITGAKWKFTRDSVNTIYNLMNL